MKKMIYKIVHNTQKAVAEDKKKHDIKMPCFFFLVCHGEVFVALQCYIQSLGNASPEGEKYI